MPNGIHQSIPVGVVMRRSPGVTRWARWNWQVVGVIPGAPPGGWRLLRRAGDSAEYHAGTVTLTLWAAETEAYRTALADTPPSLYAILRETGDADAPFEVAVVTASPFEAQDYADNGDDLVEKVAMPPGLIAWIEDFVDRHHEESTFVKRRRDTARVDLVEDGRGDPRIPQMTDVYRAPAAARKARLT